MNIQRHIQASNLTVYPTLCSIALNHYFSLVVTSNSENTVHMHRDLYSNM